MRAEVVMLRFEAGKLRENSRARKSEVKRRPGKTLGDHSFSVFEIQKSAGHGSVVRSELYVLMGDHREHGETQGRQNIIGQLTTRGWRNWQTRST
jgi:hypothetical protein